MSDFYQSLYQAETEKEEMERVFRLPVTVGKLARNPNYSPALQVTPEHIRGIINQLPSDRAVGWDGLPSNVLKHLTF